MSQKSEVRREKQTVLVFGNTDLAIDALPLKLVPELQKLFPDISFETPDPHEEWDVPKDLVVIDTALGINEVTVFDSLEAFAAPPRITAHDFDALTNLRLLKKLGKLNTVRIIGVPPTLTKEKALADISVALGKLLAASD